MLGFRNKMVTKPHKMVCGLFVSVFFFFFMSKVLQPLIYYSLGY